jgi:hypothetical protein
VQLMQLESLHRIHALSVRLMVRFVAGSIKVATDESPPKYVAQMLQ